MLLEPLVSTIEMLQERIKAHESALRENETRTRMALIDPLLTALGWDTADPALVTPEYNVSGQWADYALLGPDGKPVATVEAKKLGEPLAGHRMQMLNYSNAAGIQYAGLTDGNRWELYKVFEVGTLDERRILELSIAEGASHYLVLQLLLLWHPNMASGRPSAASEPVLAIATPPALVQTVPETICEPASEPDSILVQTVSREVTNEPSVRVEPGWTPISQVNDFSRDRRPRAIRFNRSDTYDVSRGWNYVVSQTAEWLCRQGKLTSRDCPIEVSGPRSSRNLVSTSREHQNGSISRQARETSTGLFVEVQFAPEDSIRHTQFLLEKLGVPVDTVELRFD